MEDSPQQFVQDVLEADELYAAGLNNDLLLGLFRLELVGLPEKTLHQIVDPAFNIFREKFVGDLKNLIDKTREVINNPPECIESEDLYQAVQYISTVEGPYAKDFIQSTTLKDSVVIPSGTDEFMIKLSKIPRCDNGR